MIRDFAILLLSSVATCKCGYHSVYWRCGQNNTKIETFCARLQISSRLNYEESTRIPRWQFEVLYHSCD